MMNRVRVLAAVGMLAWSANVQGAVIYSTFGPGDSLSGSGWSVGGVGGAQIAARFTPAANYTLTSIRVGAFSNTTASNFSASVNGDTSGAPGAAIATFSNALYPNPFAAIVTLTPGGSVNLSAGSTYWVILSGVGGSTGAWSQNDQGLVGNFSAWNGAQFVLQGGPTPAFDVNGDVTTGSVPEPAAIVLTALGVVGLIARRRR